MSSNISKRFSFLSALALMLTIFIASPDTAQAQYRNNGIGFSLQGLVLGSLDGINRSYGDIWGTTDHGGVSITIRSAVGYNLFVENQVSLGLGGGVNIGASAANVPSLMNATGLRYNFLDEKHRPFVGGSLVFLFLFPQPGTTSVVGNAALGGQALWVGIKPEAGYEYFFIEEQSFQIDVGPAVFVNLEQAPKFAAQLKLSWNVYF